jgi:hypothetical protein
LPDGNTAVGLRTEPEPPRYYRNEVVRLTLDDPTVAIAVRFTDADAPSVTTDPPTEFDPLEGFYLADPVLSPDGRYLAYEGHDRLLVSDLRFRDLVQRRLVESDVWESAIDGVAPALFLVQVLSLRNNGHLLIYDGRTGKIAADAAPPDDRVVRSDCRLTKESDVLCVTVDDTPFGKDKPVPDPQTFRLDRFTAGKGWRPDGLEFTAEDTGHGDPSWTRLLVVTPNGTKVAVRKTGAVILIGTKRNGVWTSREVAAPGKVVAMAFSPKGDRFAYAIEGGSRVMVLPLDSRAGEAN